MLYGINIIVLPYMLVSTRQTLIYLYLGQISANSSLVLNIRLNSF